MIRRRRARFPVPAGTAGSDIDALQTDVMRFMAIIGLCLMAVFALVQSIPVTEEAARPVLPARAATPRPALQQEKLQTIRQRIEQEIQQEKRAQQQQARQLQAELDALNSEKQQTQQILVVAQQRYEQVTGQIQQARATRARQEVEVVKHSPQPQADKPVIEKAPPAPKEHLINPSSRRMPGSRVSTSSRRMPGSRDSNPLDPGIRRDDDKVINLRRDDGKEMRDNEKEIRDDDKSINQGSPKPPPVAKQAPAEKPVPGKQGFTLRFASAAALDRLITAGSVSLYGMANQQAWRLSMQTGRPAVARASFPKRFHEMSAATVPAYYIRSLDSAADGPGSSPVVWGVQLPSATRAAITARVAEQRSRDRQGGTLVIRDNGQVLLEE